MMLELEVLYVVRVFFLQIQRHAWMYLLYLMVLTRSVPS